MIYRCFALKLVVFSECFRLLQEGVTHIGGFEPISPPKCALEMSQHAHAYLPADSPMSRNDSYLE